MSDKTFNPQEHVIDLKGKQYLQVMHRLVWFRETNPNGLIETELVSLSDQQAVFRARVALEGGGVATGYGSETPRDFADYIEKAETKAIGRALAAAGFGTQFSAHEFGGEHEAGRIVDSPVAPPNGAGSARPQQVTNGKPVIQNPNAPVSEPQRNYILGLGKQLGYRVLDDKGEWHADEAAIDTALRDDFDTTLATMTRGQASEVIEAWKERQRQQAMGGTQAELLPAPSVRFD